MPNNKVNSEDPVPYEVTVPALIRNVHDERIMEQAKGIIKKNLMRLTDVMDSPTVVSDYCIIQYGLYEHETFNVMLLDNRHRVIAVEQLFRGTIDGSAVYPREVVKCCLKYNAAAVIFTHNHPSGIPEPSMADEKITNKLIDALSHVDIRVLDHIIVGGDQTYSFAEAGKL